MAALLAVSSQAQAQEQSRESMANDNTAAQWSFQFAYQAQWDYRQDTLANGFVRPEGNKGFAQFRMVALQAKQLAVRITGEPITEAITVPVAFVGPIFWELSWFAYPVIAGIVRRRAKAMGE